MIGILLTDAEAKIIIDALGERLDNSRSREKYIETEHLIFRFEATFKK